MKQRFNLCSVVSHCSSSLVEREPEKHCVVVQIHPVRLISRHSFAQCREDWTISSVGVRASVYETEGHWFESSIVCVSVEWANG